MTIKKEHLPIFYMFPLATILPLAVAMITKSSFLSILTFMTIIIGALYLSDRWQTCSDTPTEGEQ